jgi:glutamyl-tRNA reductase
LVWHYDVDALWQAWAATSAAPQSSLAAILHILERERAALAHINQSFTESPLSATLRPRARRETERPPPLPDLTI